MNKKNILIIDDSALMRRVLSDIINSDERFQVKKVAHNGQEGMNILKADLSGYDAIILDINMPVMDGIEFLKELQQSNIRITVIVVSTLVKQGAVETIKALEHGAFDFVTKPDSFQEAKSDEFRNKIMSCLEAGIAYYRNEQRKDESVTVRIAPKKEVSQSGTGSKLVVLCCSTGGPKALQSVIPLLPENLDAPFILVQHMPEGFTQSLSERLNEMSRIKVKEAADGEKLQKGVVYIAKGGSQMRVKKDAAGNYELAVTMEGARNGLKPCADIMYESLCGTDYSEITCVVMTGMGADGTKGITELEKNNNIYVIAQDAATCTVYGMPKAIAEAGMVNEIQPLDQLAKAITEHVGVR